MVIIVYDEVSAFTHRVTNANKASIESALPNKSIYMIMTVHTLDDYIA